MCSQKDIGRDPYVEIRRVKGRIRDRTLNIAPWLYCYFNNKPYTEPFTRITEDKEYAAVRSGEQINQRRKCTMNFKEFTESIVELLEQKTENTCTVKVTEVIKNNDVHLTGVIIMRESDNICPMIYLEGAYQRYPEGASLEEIAEEIMTVYEKHTHNTNMNMGFFSDFSQVEDGIRYKLINYDKNEELLKDVPHFRWHDLAVVFYYAMKEAVFGKASILLYNDHLDMWGKTAEEIYCAAQCNMKQKMPEILVPMQELIEEMAGIKMEKTAFSLYVLTNREKLFGASAMLYSEKMKELADRLESDLLILPSSLHEVLLLPDDREQGYDFYRQMVHEVNATQVDPEEILSFNLYRYDRQKAEIEEISV